MAPRTQKFFAVAGQEKADWDIPVKAINLSDAAVPATLNLSNARGLSPTAQFTVLTATKLTDNNTLDEPARVVPAAGVVTNVSPTFRHEFAPRSFTLLRLKTR
jgi:alpha-L-arabinofuranosidase